MLGYFKKQFRKRYDSSRHYYRILDDIFGMYPNNIELYKLALIHRSASVFLPDGTQVNNERLEFLGDAVIESIVSDYLFVEFPKSDEGFLTKIRSKIVSRQSLNELCERIGLSKYIISHSPGNAVQKNLMGDAFEAMMGAIYLDKGYDFANRLLINKIFAKYLDIQQIAFTETDFKSRLIEWCQKSKHSIIFKTSKEEKSSGQNPVFRSAAMIDDMEIGFGIGSSKKEAEQNASYAVSLALSQDAGDSLLEKVDRQIGLDIDPDMNPSIDPDIDPGVDLCVDLENVGIDIDLNICPDIAHNIARDVAQEAIDPDERHIYEHLDEYIDEYIDEQMQNLPADDETE